MTKPIVWSIAGSDSGGGAGIQADLHTIQDFGVHGCTAITALTAQNSLGVKAIDYCSKEVFQAQLEVLHDDLPASVIKLGMLGNIPIIETVADFLQNYRGFVVCDPVLISTTKARLMEKTAESVFIERILPFADLVTPNLFEASFLTNQVVDTSESMVEAAKRIHNLTGKAVLIKGGHGKEAICQDFFYDSKHSYWLSNVRLENNNTHGTGCTLSSAIASCLALGYSLKDALVLAKMYVHKGIRLGERVGNGAGPVAHTGFPNEKTDMPTISEHPLSVWEGEQFPSFHPQKGRYALVRNASELERLLSQKIDTVQLRMKDLSIDQMRKEIAHSLKIARQAGMQLFLNDYWQLAIEYGVDGVHLGQEDLLTADLSAIRQNGLKLGVSTHNLHEIAIAHRLRPSYIGFGPIYPTQTKVVNEKPKGEKALALACRLSSYPVVAIGGIMEEQFLLMRACGAAAVAMTAFRT